MHKFTKKRIAIGALGLLVVAGAAVAYFTTTGSGSGNAKVGTSSALTISAVSASELYPGTTSEVTFKVKNNSPGHQFVKEIELEKVEAFEEPEEEGPIAGCKSEWFKMSNVTENKDVPGGGAETTLSVKGSLLFENKEAVSQDACKDAYLVAHFTSN